MDWGARIMAMASGQEPSDDYEALCQKIEAFTLTLAQEELFEEGLRRSIYIAPARDIEGLLSENHFDSRGFWHESQESKLLRPDGKQARIPGAFAKFSETPIQIPAFDVESSDRAGPEKTGALNPDSSDIDYALPLAGL